MERIIQKDIYRISFTLASPMSIGSGRNDSSDKDIIRDGRGEPFIPGSSLAGVLREQCSRKGFSGLPEEERADADHKYFGFVKINTDAGGIPVEDEAKSSRLLIYDAVIDQKDLDKVHITTRDHVKLDQWKTAEEGAKFDMEALEAGARFTTYIEQNLLPGDSSEMGEMVANLFLDGDVFLGAKTMRGYGEICNVSVEKASFDLMSTEGARRWIDFDMYSPSREYEPYQRDGGGHSEQSDDQCKLRISIGLHQTGGISIRKYTTEIVKNQDQYPDYEQLTTHDKDSNVAPTIPGTSWAGAFSHRMKTLASEVPEEEWRRLFGYVRGDKKARSNIRFSETTLQGAKPKILSRNAIDRFSGGAADKALFTEKTYYGGSCTLVVEFLDTPSQDVRKAFAATVCDLDEGILAVGGLTAIGRGMFKVGSINGEPVKGSLYEAVLEALDRKEA